MQYKGKYLKWNIDILPAEIEVKMPDIKFPLSLNIQPKAMPIGFMTAWIAIIIVEILTGMFASAKARPKVSPSAHLWQITAALKARVSPVFEDKPIESPSKIAWIPMAIYKIKGVRLMFFAFVFSSLLLSKLFFF